MRAEAKLAEERIEETAPLVIVGHSKLKNDGNMRLDVHRLEHSNGKSRGGGIGRSVAVDGGRGGGSARGGSTGKVKAEDRVVSHVVHGDGEEGGGEDGGCSGGKATASRRRINPSYPIPCRKSIGEPTTFALISHECLYVTTRVDLVYIVGAGDTRGDRARTSVKGSCRSRRDTIPHHEHCGL